MIFIHKPIRNGKIYTRINKGSENNWFLMRWARMRNTNVATT